MNIKSLIILISSLLTYNQLIAQDTIRRFDDLKNLIEANSLSLKQADLKLTQAKKEKLAAIYGLIEPVGSINGSYTNNTKLPVNLIPSEILGGQTGTFQEVSFGVQYVTNLNASAELSVLNFQSFENLRLSKINIQVNETGGKITQKNLLENAALIYYNILNLQEQVKALQQSFLSADTLYTYVKSRFENGLANVQELNESKISRLNVEESVKQLNFQVSQQYIALKILCDIPDNSALVICQLAIGYDPSFKPEVAKNTLLADNALEKANLARSNFRLAKYSFAPSLSVFAAYQEQQFNTRSRFFDNSKDWSASNYVGLKLSIPLPGAHSFRQTTKARYDYLIARNQATQLKAQADLNTAQMVIEHEKAKSQLTNSMEVYNLRKITYQKNFLNYREGLIGIEQVTNSFNAMVNSHYSYLSSIVNLLLAEEKININNKIK